MDNLTRANQALFEGNRSEIPHLLAGERHSGRVLWLLACAADDEDERMDLLARVYAAQEPPYALMAHGILERERTFAKQIAEQPVWQATLSQHRQTILRTVITLPVLAVVIWLSYILIFTPAPGTPDTVPTNLGTIANAATNVPTPVMTPIQASATISYMPLGSLRILNVQFPATMPDNFAQPPEGADYLLLHYEFTCGTFRNFCEEPPQAALTLALADPSAGYITPERLPFSRRAERLIAGNSWQQWVVFAVPYWQAPRSLIIRPDDDSEAPRELILDLPR